MFEALCIAVVAIWGLSEVIIGVRLRTKERGHDAGTMRRVLIAAYASVGIALYLALRDGVFIRPSTAGVIGLSAIVLGMLVRAYAIVTLRHFFTINVTLREDHRLIRTGPYRFIRHPSYTGSLLSFYGLALAVEDLWAAIVLIVPITIAFLMRIRVEEDVLRSAFPDQFPDYERATFRLFPFIY